MAIAAANANFRDGETAADQAADIQAAIVTAVANSGYDALVTQAALNDLANAAPAGSPTALAASNLQTQVARLAKVELQNEANPVSTPGPSAVQGSQTPVINSASSNQLGVSGAVTDPTAQPDASQILVHQIEIAVAAVKSNFTPNESADDQAKAIQAAIVSAVENSGYDALTTQAALNAFASTTSPGTPTAQATVAPQTRSAPLVTNEVQNQSIQSTTADGSGSSNGGSSGSGSSGAGLGAAGGSGGGGGGGGYVNVY